MIRPGETAPSAVREAKVVEQPYHSAYHTENPYLDGRNLILDGRLQEAIDTLTQAIYSLDHPNRAAMWVFICKCRLGDTEGAAKFLMEFVIPLKQNPLEERAVAILMRYYLGGMTDRDLMKRFASWDDLDNCAAYYYYGAYKKYFEKDYVTGNDFIARCVRTKIFDYSEYKFAETELKGYTLRDVGQYKDFPIVQAPHSEAGFLEPIMDEDLFPIEGEQSLDEGYVPEYADPFPDTGIALKGDQSKPPLNIVPSNVGEDQFVIPSLDHSGWEVVDERQLLASFKEEAIAIIDNLMVETPYFYLDSEDNIQFYPLTSNFLTYAVSFEDFMENFKHFEERYKVEYSIVSLYLSKGDYLAGVKLPCRTYNFLTDLYGDDLFVTVNLLFSVNDDRTVEMVYKYSKVF
jgi:hypothetical protein